MITDDSNFLNQLTFEPLGKENWFHFENLFGTKGACGNCWCMSFRLTKSDFDAGKEEDGNKNAMRALVEKNKPTGLMAFYQGIPIAWCALAPREDFLKLEKSRVHKRIDDQEVWSIPCFYIAKEFRRMGVSVALLKGAIDYASSQGIRVLEAYPSQPTTEKLPDAFLWIGHVSSFQKAGFQVVDRTSKNRPMMRYFCSPE